MADKPSQYIGTHVHRHGESTYLLQSKRELGMEDFITFLGEDFEPDREDEYLIFERADPININ